MKHKFDFYLGCCCGSCCGIIFDIGFTIEQFFYNLSCCNSNFYEGYTEAVDEIIE